MIEVFVITKCNICGSEKEMPEWDWVSNPNSRFKCEKCGKLRFFIYDGVRRHTEGSKS